MSITLGDFVTHLLFKLQKNGIALPFDRMELWHILFYRLQSERDPAELPEFLKNLQFDWDAPHPKSQEIAEYLNAVLFTGMVITTTPYGNVYKLSDWTEDFLADRHGTLDNFTKRCLRHALKIAREEFKKEKSE